MQVAQVLFLVGELDLHAETKSLYATTKGLQEASKD